MYEHWKVRNNYVIPSAIVRLYLRISLAGNFGVQPCEAVVTLFFVWEDKNIGESFE